MQQTRYQRGGRAAGRSRDEAGLFADGIWHCNCSPRLPAENFRVKKEGKNQGRWFYTCQQREKQRCGFFLWDEDAKPREAGAVLNNTRNEPEPRSGNVKGKGLFADMPQRTKVRENSPTPTFSSSSPNSPTAHGVKRSAQEANFEDDDPFPWPLNGAEERELVTVADATVQQTPHKSAKTGVYATPETSARKSIRKLPWLEQSSARPSTPTSGARTALADDYLTTPSKAPSGPSIANQPPHTPPFMFTPAGPSPLSPPSRYRDALNNPADATSTLTNEVMHELSGLPLPPEKLSSVRSLLTKHDLRTQGVTRGRDISRVAIKTKDARIAELEAKIAGLEAEREVHRGIIKKLKG